MKTLDELSEVYWAGYTKHRLFWEGVDSLTKRDLVKYATLLVESRLMQEDWFTLVQLLGASEHWTTKQRRRVAMLIIVHWQDLSVLLELS
jgi:hypothetical protein